MPEWFSILPPLVAIALAFILREVVVSLFAGVWLGAFFLAGYHPLDAFLNVLERFVKPAIANPSHAEILIFTMMLGGVSGVINKNGGTAGLVKTVIRWATTPFRGQLATYLMGLVIFFDDYANTIIVGNSMRPITDRLKISREKLSYIVDSTAAADASLVLSTWIGFELGLIGEALKQTGYQTDPFSVFVHSIPYSFYPLFALLLVGVVIFSRRDFGSMYQAEHRARTTGKVFRDGAHPASDLSGAGELMHSPSTPLRWINGLLPVLTVVVVVILRIYVTGTEGVRSSGGEMSVRNILGQSNSSRALLWSSISGCTVAILLSWGQRILTLSQAMEAWFIGVRSMFLACLILVLAWSLAEVTTQMKTAEFVVGGLSGRVPPFILPAATFVIACLISFATGTSWGTMAILFPIVIPLVWALNPSSPQFLHLSVSSVLAGAIFGDHCSPVSDTTVMSSMSSGCDHMDHTRTQMPYALLAATVSLVVGLIPAGLGLPPYYSLAAGLLVLFLFLRLVGRRVEG